MAGGQASPALQVLQNAPSRLPPHAKSRARERNGAGLRIFPRAMRDPIWMTEAAPSVPRRQEERSLGNSRNLVFWAILVLLMVTLFSVLQDGSGASRNGQLSFSEFMQKVESNEIREVTIDGEKIELRTSDNRRFTTVKPGGIDIVADLRNHDVIINVDTLESGIH